MKNMVIIDEGRIEAIEQMGIEVTTVHAVDRKELEKATALLLSVATGKANGRRTKRPVLTKKLQRGKIVEVKLSQKAVAMLAKGRSDSSISRVGQEMIDTLVLGEVYSRLHVDGIVTKILGKPAPWAITHLTKSGVLGVVKRD